MFDKMISWGELITLVMFVLGSALLFYLILAISHLVKVLKNVNEILVNNKENIQKTVEKLPEITENSANITKMVRSNLDSIQHVFDDVGKISETVKNGVETIQKDIILKVKSILDIFDAVKKAIEKRRENKKKKSTVYKYTYKPGQDKPEEVEIISTDMQDEEPYKGYVKDESEKGTANDIEDYKDEA